MHFHHPFTSTLSLRLQIRMCSQDTELCPLVLPCTAKRIDHCWFNRKSIYHIRSDFPSLPFSLYSCPLILFEPGHFLEVTLRKFEFYGILPERHFRKSEGDLFTCAIEFYSNEHHVVYFHRSFNRRFITPDVEIYFFLSMCRLFVLSISTIYIWAIYSNIFSIVFFLNWL